MTMKQKVVIKISLGDQKKGRCKAMKIAVSVSGVESAALQGPDKDQIEVIGEQIDAVALTMLLRKNVGHAEIMTVGPLPEKKPEEKKPQANKSETTPMAPLVLTSNPYGDGCVPVYQQIYDYPSRDPTCSIM